MCAERHTPVRIRPRRVTTAPRAKMSPHMRTTTTIAALLLMTTVLAACGSSDRGTPTLTRAQYIAKADALCKASNVRTRGLDEQLDREAAGVSANARLLRRLAPILRGGYAPVAAGARAFEATTPPVADAVAIERIRETYDQQAELVRRLANAAQRGDEHAFTSLSRTRKDVVARTRRLTRAFGFEECGSAKSDAAGA